MNASTARSALVDGTRTSLLSSSGRGWNGFGAELLGISAGTHRIAGGEQHRIGVHVGKPVRANCVCDGKRLARIQAHGDADVIPAGMDGVWADDSDCTILRIWIDDAFVKTLHEQLELKPSRARFSMHLQLRDSRLQHLAWALHAELQAEEASDALFAESLCTAMLVRLLGRVPSLEARAKTFAPKAAARLTDYIEGSLDQRLTLSELAALLDISVPHFKVLFRETFGVPVHRYIVQRRVERAKSLLLTGRISAAQVALEAGFAHQSHMAHWMNRLLGVGPSELMKAK
ncbi:helix-turn-helix transcriptional regulator [Trinickia dinghuensis]|uniref:AraC family transcriptional regulator n=1 Tax=Trinickia dinghuensis TaxID=2291023 RepID=A0A3D8K2B3_9BURK|nr:AraC family transcriptional regulator [Trinickia dinghuensis]RDU98995.1 AraC family transcriptional regulator [Trinickia dinghuensis]